MFAHKCFHVLLWFPNNSIKNQSFVYIQLNDQTVLFLTIQFSISTELKSSKYCHVLLTIQLNISHLFTLLTIQFSKSTQFKYPWPSLATSPYRSSPLAGLQGYISYPHIAAVCMFEQVVLLLPGHMWGTKLHIIVCK